MPNKNVKDCDCATSCRIVDDFRTLVSEQAGLVLSGERDDRLMEMISDRMDKTGRNGWQSYKSFLNRGDLAAETEWQILIKQLTIGESYFFRDVGQLEMVAQTLLPVLVDANREKQRIMAWSAGCATGEEAYTLAMMLETSPLIPDKWSIEVMGSDINEEFLAAAKTGRYTDWSFRNFDPGLKEKYFTRHRDRWQISPSVRARVSFKRVNLIKDAFDSGTARIHGMDLIICRNVFIYFGQKDVSRVMEKFAAALNPGGVLLTGHAEVETYPDQLLERVSHGGYLVYRRRRQDDPAAETAGSLAGYVSGGQVRRRFSVSATGPGSVPGFIMKPETDISIPIQKTAPPRMTRKRAPRVNFPDTLKTDVVQKMKNLLIQGRYRELTELSNTLKIQDDTVLILMARAAANQGRLETAEVLCRKALARNDLNASACHLLAVISLARNRLEDARSYFDKAVYLDPAFPAPLLGLADLLAGSGEKGKISALRTRAAQLITGLPKDETVEYYEDYARETLLGLLKRQTETERKQ